MRYTADHAFHIGVHHLRGGLPCQDYAVSAEVKGMAYAIVSDGCSSGRHTDIGARIIAMNTASSLLWTRSQFFPRAAIADYCKYHDEIARAQLGLEQRDMLATCGYVAVVGNSVVVDLAGDGVIAAKRANGEIVMTKIDWADNAPLYRTYATDDYFQFKIKHGGDGAMAATVTRRTGQGSSWSEKVIQQSINDMLPSFGDFIGVRDFEFFAVFSDGVCQVPGMKWYDVVAQLMDFKSTEGMFVKRRMNRFMHQRQLHGLEPIDDIAMACIHVTQDEPEEKPEPCTAEAREEGCTCGMESVNSASIDPPEPIINPWCPVHGGRDPDAERDRQIDDGDR